MKTIRYGTFETNSSSTHSMIIPVEKPAGQLPPFIGFRLGEFGWGFEEVNRFDYLYTALMLRTDKESHDRFVRLKKVCLANGVKDVKFQEARYSRWDDYDEDDGRESASFWPEGFYIDHYEEIDDFLNTVFESDEILLNYLMGGRVGTGNDNSTTHNPIEDFYDRLSREEKNKYIYCSKGN